MPEITAGKKKFAFIPGEKKNLMQLLIGQNLLIDNSCNGKGVCGKCKVRLTGGNIPPVSPAEQELLSRDEILQGIRLACLIVPEADLQVELLHKERKHKILTEGYMPDFERCPAVSKKRIRIEKADLERQTPFEEQILQQTGADEVDFDVLAGSIFEPGEYTAVIYETDAGSRYRCSGKKVVRSLEKGDTEKCLFGAAVDIGTTTVVVSLIDLITGQEIGNASRINAQKHFGLDVLTRITCEMERPREAAKELQEAIVGSINEMLEAICNDKGISTKQIYEITAAANCTMMHMLLGIDARSIGKSPYAPIFVRGRTIPADKINLSGADGAVLYCLPSVSAYIGADIAAGAYVCKLHQAKDKVLFIDIGTNGEIVLSDSGKMLCCSCAAGPALEGMNISCGMRAAQGAIEEVEITPEGVKLSLIGSEEDEMPQNPEGICGSGILAVIRELVRTGLIKKDGAFIRPEKLDPDDYRYSMLQLNGKKREFVLTESPERLVITQGDVRQVQLAKGAILSGFLTLLQKTGISMEELDRIMIAGQFGAHLPAESLTGTGIIPQAVGEKLIYVGNSSKTGAVMALLSVRVRREMENAAENMTYLELGNTPGYERLFAECMLFKNI